MTLKENITQKVLDLPLVSGPSKREISDYENGISNLEQIADDYAIEFANWFVLRYTEAVFYREDYTEDLLEEFKKEKQL